MYTMTDWESLEKIQTIARNGLHYADNPYDIERYERILEVAKEQYAVALDESPEEVSERFADELGHVTPQLGAVAIIREGDRVLVMKRSDNGQWCLPGGFVDPGESPAEAVEREVMEETGISVTGTELLFTNTRIPGPNNGPRTVVEHVFRCDWSSGDLELSHEGDALEFKKYTDITNWAFEHQELIQRAMDHFASKPSHESK